MDQYLVSIAHHSGALIKKYSNALVAARAVNHGRLARLVHNPVETERQREGEGRERQA